MVEKKLLCYIQIGVILRCVIKGLHCMDLADGSDKTLELCVTKGLHCMYLFSFFSSYATFTCNLNF